MSQAEQTAEEITPLTRTTASVRVSWDLYDAERKKTAGWNHIYPLSETAAGLRAIAALPDDATWAMVIKR